MKYISVALLTISCIACDFVGSNEIVLTPIIRMVENTEAGTLVTVNTDGNRALDLIGVEYRSPGGTFFFQNQVIPNSVSDSIIVPDLNDGTYEFRAFIAYDSYYGYSEIVEHEVVSPTPDIPCAPAANTTRSNILDINCSSSLRISAGVGFRGIYEVEVECPTGQPIKFRFPREPNSGVYTTIAASVEDVEPSDRFVNLNYQTAFSGNFNIKQGERVYVERTTSTTTITLCNIDASNARFTTASISGRYVINR
ncbi:MAG: hypothetical protein AAGF89_09775 [Bacteroidota bacterium]